MDADRQGQSIAELLISIAVGAIFIAAAGGIIAPALRESSQAGNVQEGATVAQALIGDARVWSEASWSNVTALATGTAYQYHLITSSTPYVATSGAQSVVIGTTTFTSYFYLSDAYRTSAGAPTTATSGNTYDPSTKFLTVVYNWVHGTTSTVGTYITRHGDDVTDQTDWSGGPGASGAATSVGNQFSTSTNISYSTVGAISVALGGTYTGGDWVLVPGNPTFGTSDFYVMKYDTGCVNASTGVAVSSPMDGNAYDYSSSTSSACVPANGLVISSVPNAIPIVDITQASATAACGYVGGTLMSNADWQTIAWNVEEVASNWSGGAVGSGTMYSGHSDGVPYQASVASADDSQDCVGTDGPSSCGGTGSNTTQVRTLTLSNGGVVWDMGGNLYQWMSDTIIGNDEPNVGSGGYAWNEFTAITNWGAMTQQTAGPENSAWNSSQGIGQIESGDVATDTEMHPLARGGYWANDQSAGIESLFLQYDPGWPNDYAVGFRCVKPG